MAQQHAATVEGILLEGLEELEPREDFGPHLEALKERFPARLVAVLLYGSKIARKTERGDSIHDFIIIIEGWRGTSMPLRSRLLSPLLPPTSLSMVTPEGRLCKGFVLTRKELVRACDPGQGDIYVVGRLGKRVLPLMTSGQEVLPWLSGEIARGLRGLRPLILHHLGPTFTREEYVLESLRISYRAELRVERGSKVRELLEAFPEYYGRLYGRLLEELVREGVVLREGAVHRKAEGGDLARALLAAWRIQVTRGRGVARWPKHMATVEDWAEIMVSKISRATGLEVRLSPWERRHPVLASAPVFFKLVRRGLIR